MNIEWFKNPDNLTYIDGTKPMDHLANQFQISNFVEEVNSFHQNPIKEGKTLLGKKRTSIKLFIPDLTFNEHIEMGENIFVYSGCINNCYVIYFPLTK